jgi:hypothetical protein
MDGERLVSHRPDRVHDQRQRRDMIEMRVRYEDMVDELELGQGEVRDPGSSIDQDVLIDQHRGRPQVSADPAAAPQNPNLHRYFASKR